MIKTKAPITSATVPPRTLTQASLVSVRLFPHIISDEYKGREHLATLVPRGPGRYGLDRYLAAQELDPNSNMESSTPIMPLSRGRSSLSTQPRSMPHTEAVAKTRPVLAALVKLIPKVKAV
jgi:hypothetical protein